MDGVHSRSQSPCTKKGSVAKVLALKNVVVQEFAERSQLKLCGVTDNPSTQSFYKQSLPEDGTSAYRYSRLSLKI